MQTDTGESEDWPLSHYQLLFLSPSKETSTQVKTSAVSKKMRIHVQIAGECLALSFPTSGTVESIPREAVHKLAKLKPILFTKGKKYQ